MLAARVLFFLLFVYVGGHGNYFGIWLRDEAGWSENAIGWQGGIHYVCLVAFPLLWGYRIDRSGDPGRVLRLIATAAALMFVPFALTTAVAPLLLTTFAFGAFRTGMVTAADSFTLAHIARDGGDYGRTRIWGSLGFIVGGFAMAALVSHGGRGVVPWTLVAILVITAALTALLPGRLTTPPQRAESLVTGLRRLLGRSNLRRFYVVTFASRLVSQGLYIFLPLHLKDLGVPETEVPLYWTVGVVSEILLMANAAKLFGRIQARHLLATCFFLSAVQYGLFSAITVVQWLLAVMLLHGMTFGIWYYASVTWLNDAVDPGDRARAQGLFQSIGFGVGGTVSAIGCGYLYEVAGGTTMFAVAGVGMLAVTVLAARALP